MRIEYLYLAIIVFVLINCILVISMLVIISNKRRLTEKWDDIASQIEQWLMEVILEKQNLNNDGFVVPPAIHQLLQKMFSKKVLLAELMKAKKSLRGISGNNVEKLYNQLGFNSISMNRVVSKHWHIQARGIQELAMMNQHSRLTTILELTNHSNPMVRMEAQTALVCLQGLQGLHFFNNLSYPLSNWHQLNLLHLVAHQSNPNGQDVRNWLNSPNDTIVQFCLKLIGIQHAFQFYEEVVHCLQNKNEIIRREAVLCLGQLPSVAANMELIDYYTCETDKNIRLSIIGTLQMTGSEQDIPFLQKLLRSRDGEIRLAVSKTVLHLQNNINTSKRSLAINKL